MGEKIIPAIPERRILVCDRCGSEWDITDAITKPPEDWPGGLQEMGEVCVIVNTKGSLSRTSTKYSFCDECFEKFITAFGKLIDRPI